MLKLYYLGTRGGKIRAALLDPEDMTPRRVPVKDFTSAEFNICSDKFVNNNHAGKDSGNQSFILLGVNSSDEYKRKRNWAYSVPVCLVCEYDGLLHYTNLVVLMHRILAGHNLIGFPQFKPSMSIPEQRTRLMKWISAYINPVIKTSTVTAEELKYCESGVSDTVMSLQRLTEVGTNFKIHANSSFVDNDIYALFNLSTGVEVEPGYQICIEPACAEMGQIPLLEFNKAGLITSIVIHYDVTVERMVLSDPKVYNTNRTIEISEQATCVHELDVSGMPAGTTLTFAGQYPLNIISDKLLDAIFGWRGPCFTNTSTARARTYFSCFGGHIKPLSEHQFDGCESIYQCFSGAQMSGVLVLPDCDINSSFLGSVKLNGLRFNKLPFTHEIRNSFNNTQITGEVEFNAAPDSILNDSFGTRRSPSEIRFTSTELSVGMVSGECFYGTNIKQLHAKPYSVKTKLLNDRRGSVPADISFNVSGIDVGTADILSLVNTEGRTNEIIGAEKYIELGDKTFSLTHLDFGVGLETITKLGSGAFRYIKSSLLDLRAFPALAAIETNFICDGEIEDLIIPDTVTELAEGAFDSTNKLRHIWIPESITFIPKELFKTLRQKQKSYPEVYTVSGSYAQEWCKKNRVPCVVAASVNDCLWLPSDSQIHSAVLELAGAALLGKDKLHPRAEALLETINADRIPIWSGFSERYPFIAKPETYKSDAWYTVADIPDFKCLNEHVSGALLRLICRTATHIPGIVSLTADEINVCGKTVVGGVSVVYGRGKSNTLFEHTSFFIVIKGTEIILATAEVDCAIAPVYTRGYVRSVDQGFGPFSYWIERAYTEHSSDYADLDKQLRLIATNSNSVSLSGLPVTDTANRDSIFNGLRSGYAVYGMTRGAKGSTDMHIVSLGTGKLFKSGNLAGAQSRYLATEKQSIFKWDGKFVGFTASELPRTKLLGISPDSIIKAIKVKTDVLSDTASKILHTPVPEIELLKPFVGGVSTWDAYSLIEYSKHGGLCISMTDKLAGNSQFKERLSNGNVSGKDIYHAQLYVTPDEGKREVVTLLSNFKSFLKCCAEIPEIKPVPYDAAPEHYALTQKWLPLIDFIAVRKMQYSYDSNQYPQVDIKNPRVFIGIGRDRASFTILVSKLSGLVCLAVATPYAALPLCWFNSIKSAAKHARVFGWKIHSFNSYSEQTGAFEAALPLDSIKTDIVNGECLMSVADRDWKGYNFFGLYRALCEGVSGGWLAGTPDLQEMFNDAVKQKPIKNKLLLQLL